MRTRRSFAGTLLLSAFVTAIAAKATPLELAFDLNPARGAILIQGQLNGKPAAFLLDTGAGISDVVLYSVSLAGTVLVVGAIAGDNAWA